MTGEAVYGRDKHFEFMTRCYEGHSSDEQTGYRSALFDAAHLADAIGRDIVAKHTVRGRLTNHGREMERVAKRIGDAIWVAREELRSLPASAPTEGGTRDG